MANDLTRALWSHKMPATRKLVLIYLADRANTEHCTWPAVATISAETGLGRSTVFRCLEELREAGYIDSRQRWNDSNVYTVMNPQSQSETRPGVGRPPSRSGTVIPKVPPTGSSTARAKLDFTSWPSEPSDDALAGWLEVRRKKRAPVNEQIMERMGRELHAAKAKGWTVDDVLEECAWKGWQGFRADWLEPKATNGKPQPVRAGAGTASPPHGRHDYARGRQGGNNGARGGAIDRVLGNARARAEEAAATDGAGSDRGDDDGGVRPSLDFDPR